MCGIAGILAPDPSAAGCPEVARAVRRMSDLQAHRGPDDEGFEIVGPCALGHRRLSILDLSSRGRQPMAYADGNLTIVHNGEVYNYLELRDELRGLGHEFRTDTDTEVILAGYDRWGSGILDRLNGMWAFAIWDARRQRLFCARDRFGIKPFHYIGLQNGSFAFASEPKAFRGIDGWSPEPDPGALYHYLAESLVNDSERTFYRGVSSLPPAHVLTVRPGGKPRIRRWWSARDLDPRPAGPDREVVEEARRILKDAVRVRLRSDVPVGTCLSGGIDSSTVVGLVADVRAEREIVGQHTFSACFTGPGIDERPYMDLVLDRTGATPHRVFPRGPDLVADLSHLVWTQDEPFGSASIYAQYRVFSIVRDAEVIVTLDGQGADELMAGYDAYHSSLVLDGLRRFSLACALRNAKLLGELRGRSAPSLVKDALRQARRLGGRPRRAPDWLRPDLVAGARGEAPYAIEEPGGGGPLLDHLWRDLSRTLLPGLLRYADRNAMAHSVEARFPFLDVRFVELVRRLPLRFLIRDGWTKWLLRAAGAPWLPEEVRVRKDKIAFAPPSTKWFRESLGDRLDEVLSDAHPRVEEFCDLGAVRNRWSAFREGRAGYRSQFWHLLNLEEWLRQLPLREPPSNS